MIYAVIDMRQVFLLFCGKADLKFRLSQAHNP